MRKSTSFIFFSLLLFLTGCSSSNHGKNDLFQYKNSYIGDASALGNIIWQLPASEHFIGMELETTNEPYGMILNYTDEEVTNDAMKETILYNATFVFTLVKNADWITFNFGNQTQKISRKELQDWYGKELASYTNVNDLHNLTQQYIEDKPKVHQFFEE